MKSFQSHHSNTEIHAYSVFHPEDMTDRKSDLQMVFAIIIIMTVGILFRLPKSIFVIENDFAARFSHLSVSGLSSR